MQIGTLRILISALNSAWRPSRLMTCCGSSFCSSAGKNSVLTSVLVLRGATHSAYLVHWCSLVIYTRECQCVSCSSFHCCNCVCLFFDRKPDSLGLPQWESPWRGGQPLCEGPDWNAVLLPDICISKEVQPHPLAPSPGLVLPNSRLWVSEILSPKLNNLIFIMKVHLKIFTGSPKYIDEMPFELNIIY